MLEQRNLKLDLLALGLLALTIFLAAALLSYDPADPPSKLVFPERAETLNVCGRSGAVVSRMLFDALGLGAYYLLFSLVGLDAVLLARRTITQPALRTGGWLLSLTGVTTLAALAVPWLSPGPMIGSGGYLAAAGRGLLQMHFAAVGAYILALSLILGGSLTLDPGHPKPDRPNSELLSNLDRPEVVTRPQPAVGPSRSCCFTSAARS